MNPQTKHIIAYYWRHARARPKELWGALIAVPLTTLVNAYLPPLVLAHVVNKLSQHQYTDDIIASFGYLILLYAALLLLGLGLWRVVDYFVWRLELRIEQSIAEEVFAHMLTETADFHANNFAGSLVSQNNKLMAGYIRLADTTLYQAYPLFSGIIFTTVILLPHAPLYSLLVLAFAVTYIVTAFRVSRPVQKLSAKSAAAESIQTGNLADAITNATVIKSFARGTYERGRFHAATSNTRKASAEFARIHKRQMNILGFLGRSISVVAFVMAIVSVVVFNVELGVAFLILSYTSGVADQLFSFGNGALRNYNRTFGDASDMVKILRTQPQILDPKVPEPSRMSQGAIAFENVTFTHNGSDDAIFENFTIAIKPGEKIGLVGHSGSGKTTFTRLLLRFSDVDRGAITVDGQNIAHVTQDDLHSQIAYVPQEPLLFHRTIAENIGYGQANTNHTAITKAARYAHADEFIETLPDGYDTLVGERGVKLSGGQRQRVAIARAMLKDAPILLLDEATSALDSESEVLIQDALWRLMENRTAIVIAHRLSTIQKMDRIVVLDNGTIAEQGTHKELLRKKNGTYAKLWAHQSGGFIED